ncbi:MAG: hypothetical protein GY935_03015 [Gammaproteobacteria bacterium]|nr:hypothetical protein [Gammaproteobacteria bacterium]
MSTSKGKQRNPHYEPVAEFSIQICSTEGRLVSEYTQSRRRNRVKSLNAAERYVRKRLANRGGSSVIIVISEDRIDEFRQTQSQVSFDATRH